MNLKQGYRPFDNEKKEKIPNNYKSKENLCSHVNIRQYIC